MVSLLDQQPDDVRDPRHTKGRWHPWHADPGIIALAKLCGVLMGQRQIAVFARRLTQPQRRAPGCRRDPDDPRRRVVPAESSYQRALAALDPDRIERLLLDWQHQRLGPTKEDLIAIDGKHLRRSGGLALANAIDQPSQRVHATVTLAQHQSEITAVPELLKKTEFTG